MPIKLRTPAGWRDGSAWLFALLALLTLLPSAFVLWFMNDALARESAGARQRVLEAYRGQLRLVRSRLDPIWRAHAGRLNAGLDSERLFEHLITRGIADGAVMLAADGGVDYPNRNAGRRSGGTAIEQPATRRPRSRPSRTARPSNNSPRD